MNTTINTHTYMHTFIHEYAHHSFGQRVTVEAGYVSGRGRKWSLETGRGVEKVGGERGEGMSCAGRASKKIKQTFGRMVVVVVVVVFVVVVVARCRRRCRPFAALFASLALLALLALGHIDCTI